MEKQKEFRALCLFMRIHRLRLIPPLLELCQTMASKQRRDSFEGACKQRCPLPDFRMNLTQKLKPHLHPRRP